ncbi:MAG TPA: M42 family metallopeptidase [Methanomicrobiales archaeon]|nr:M42 family metallopeptidase [Methanomicrobiales archaeon]
MREILGRLSNAHGVSGSEGSVEDIIRAELRGSVDEIREDALGNLIAVKKGGAFSVMIASHMDEIGLMVNYIDEKGFLRFVTFGGWYAPTLYNQRVILHGFKGPVTGVVGGKPPHVMDEEERKRGVKAENMFIDVGASSAKEVARLGLEIGTPVTVDRELADLAGRRVTGKAFDNRVGCAVLVKVLKELKSPHTVYGVFTVQEEVGTKGARTSAFSLDPDCAIALDSTFPGDHPDIDKKDSCLEMGKGPAITVSDANGRGLIADRRMVAWLRKVAEKKKIPYQLEVGHGGTTDASSIHLVKSGIPSTVISVPVRYIHSPVEVADLRDMEASARLLLEALKGNPKGVSPRENARVETRARTTRQ